MKTIEEVLAFNLKRFRGSRTQAFISEATGIAFRTYQHLEQGVSVPQKPQREAICNFFGVDEMELFVDPDRSTIINPTNEELSEMVLQRMQNAAQTPAKGPKEVPNQTFPESQQRLVELVSSAAFQDDERARKYFALLKNVAVYGASNSVKKKDRLA